MHPITSSPSSPSSLFIIGGTCTSTNTTVTIEKITFQIALATTPSTIEELRFNDKLFTVSDHSTLILSTVELSGTTYNLNILGTSLQEPPILFSHGIVLSSESSLIINSSSSLQSIHHNGSSFISPAGTSTIKLQSLEFLDIATVNAGGSVLSGTLKSGGSLTVDGCTFRDCSTLSHNGGAMNIQIEGGDVRMGQTGSVTFTECYASQNTSETLVPLRPIERFGGSGGALYISISSGTLQMGSDYTLTFDECYGDKEVGFGGAYYISHTGNTAHITFGSQTFVTSPEDSYQVSTQGTFVYFVSSVPDYITASDRFKDLLENIKPDSGKIIFNVLDAFVAYDAPANKTYQMYMIGSTDETIVMSGDPAISNDKGFCGIVYPCSTLQGAVSYAGEFVNKPTVVRLQTYTTSPYTISTVNMTLSTDITVQGEDDGEEKQQVAVSPSQSSGSVFIIAANIEFKDIIFKLYTLYVPLFKTQETGTLTLTGIAFDKYDSFYFRNTLIDASLSTLTLTNCDLDFTSFISPTSTFSGEALILASHFHDGRDIDRSYSGLRFSIANIPALSIQLTDGSTALTNCLFSQANTRKRAAALKVEVSTADATLENLTFLSTTEQDDAQLAYALDLSVADGAATLTGCNFYNLISSNPVLTITVIGTADNRAVLDITNCNFLGSYTTSTSIVNFYLANTDTTITKTTFNPAEYTRPSESSESEGSSSESEGSSSELGSSSSESDEESSSQSPPNYPDATAMAISVTCANGSFAISDGCSFEFFKSTPVSLTVRDIEDILSPASQDEEISSSVSLTFDHTSFTNCEGGSNKPSAISVSFSGTQQTTTTSLSLSDCTFTDCYKSAVSTNDTVSVDVKRMGDIQIQNNVFANTRDESTDTTTGEVTYGYPKTGRAVTLKIDTADSLAVKSNSFEYFTGTSGASSVYIYASSTIYQIDEVSFEGNTFTSGLSDSTDNKPNTFVSLGSLAGKSLTFESNMFTAYRPTDASPSLSCGGGVSVIYTPVTRNGSVTFNNNTFTGLHSSANGTAIKVIIKGDESDCLPSLSFTNITCTQCTTTSSSGEAIYLSCPPLFTVGRLTIADCIFTDCYTQGVTDVETVYASVFSTNQFIISNNAFTNTPIPYFDDPTQTPCCPPSSSEPSTLTPSGDDVVTPSGFIYPETGRALSLEIENCESLSLTDNTFSYFTSSSDGSSISVSHQYTTSTFQEISFKENAFLSGTSSNDMDIGTYVLLSNIHGDILFESNTFTAALTENISAAYGGAVQISYCSSNENSSTTFVANTFTNLPSDSATYGTTVYLAADSSQPLSISITDCTFTNCYSLDDVVYIETKDIREITIQNNTFTNGMLAPIDYPSSSSSASSSDQQSSSNSPSDSDSSAVSLSDSPSPALSANDSPSPAESTSTSDSSPSLSDYTYPITGRALVLRVDSCDALTIKKNYFQSFTSADELEHASSLLITSSRETSEYETVVPTLLVEDNTFITGTSDSNSPGYCAVISAKVSSAVINSNVFIAHHSEEATGHCVGGIAVYISGKVSTKNPSISFTNTICTGFSSNPISSFTLAALLMNVQGFEVVDIQNNTISNCQTSGAAIALVDTKASIRNFSFVDCTSSYLSGGLDVYTSNATLTLTDVGFSSCSSPDTSDGGSLYLECSHSNITFESPSTDLPTFFNSSAGNGGALYIKVTDNTGSIPQSTITLTGQHFDHCKAKNSGGAIYASGSLFQLSITNVTISNSEAWMSGALYLHLNSSVLFLMSTTFTNCTASRRGGAAYIYNTQEPPADGDTDTESTRDTLGSVETDTTSEPVRDAHVYISEVVAENCSVTGESSGGGMCIFLKNGSLNMTASVFTTCTSTYNGGGLYLIVENNTNATLHSTSFTECTSTHNGGGALLSLSNGSLEIAGCTFEKCQSKDNGGGVYLGMTSGSIDLHPAHITDDTSRTTETPVSFINCQAGVTIKQASTHSQANRETGYGGAMYIQITAHKKTEKVKASPTSSPASSSDSYENITTYDTDNMIFSFADVKFVGSSAIKGNYLYVLTNYEGILEREAWKDLVPSASYPSDFVYSVANVTEPVNEVSLSETTLSRSSRSKGMSGGAIAGLVIGILAFVGLIVAGVLVYLFFFRGRSSKADTPTSSDSTAADDSATTDGSSEPEASSASRFSFFSCFRRGNSKPDESSEHTSTSVSTEPPEDGGTSKPDSEVAMEEIVADATESDNIAEAVQPPEATPAGSDGDISMDEILP